MSKTKFYKASVARCATNTFIFRPWPHCFKNPFMTWRVPIGLYHMCSLKFICTITTASCHIQQHSLFYITELLQKSGFIDAAKNFQLIQIINKQKRISGNTIYWLLISCCWAFMLRWVFRFRWTYRQAGFFASLNSAIFFAADFEPSRYGPCRMHRTVKSKLLITVVLEGDFLHFLFISVRIKNEILSSSKSCWYASYLTTQQI